jgi:hypothetical protein
LPLFKMNSKRLSALLRLLRLAKGKSADKTTFSREQKSEAVVRFTLAMSDQQLVTGLAILIGTIANMCRISFYEFQVATSLAWFSATTHLATLDVLRGYFRLNRGVCYVRVVGITVNLILLGISLIAVSMGNGPDYLINPVQCVFSPNGLDNAASNSLNLVSTFL